jgi:hypothetical protein
MALGQMLLWNMDSAVRRPFDEFAAAVGKDYVGIHRRTLYQSLNRNIRKSMGFYVTLNKDGSVAILRIAKMSERDTRGVQVATLLCGGNKYSYNELRRLPEWYDPIVTADADMVALEDAISKSQEETKYINGGMISDNTSRHIVLGMCFGILVRSQGGVYFINNSYQQEFDDYMAKVSSFMGTANVDTMRIPVENTPDGVKAIATAARADIMSRVQDAIAQAHERTTQRGWQTQIGAINDNLHLLDMYEGVLQVKMDDLRAQIQASQVLIRSKINKEIHG